MTPEDLSAFAKVLAEQNNLDLPTAEKYASIIGDTPELAENGKVIVRDNDDRVLAEVIVPFDV